MEYINIMDFGAKGDGKSDDTKALEAAMKKASITDGTVYIPRGMYMIHPVKVPSHITIKGNSSWGYSAWGYENNKLKEGAPFDPDYNGNTVFIPLSCDEKALFNLSGSCGTKISDITFDGKNKGNNFSCIYVSATEAKQNVVFEGIRISHFSGCGIVLENACGFAIRKSLIIMNKSHAVYCSNSRDGSVTDNQLAYNSGAGFFAPGCEKNGGFGVSGVMFTGNRIEGGNPGGIYLFDSDSISITGNSFDSCRGASITLMNCRCGAVTGNMARISGREHEDDQNTHLRMENCCGIAFVGNSFWGWFALIREEGTHYGMVLRKLTNCLVTQNALLDISQKELIKDYGGHKESIIASNAGKLFDIKDLPENVPVIYQENTD